MEIEIVYNNDGDVMVTDSSGNTEYYFAEYDIPRQIIDLLEYELPKYQSAESGENNE